MENQKIDFSRFTQAQAQTHENEETRRQQDAQPRLRADSAGVSYYRAELEKAGWSEFSGGKWGGRSR